jgi:hypothetical protein
MLRLDCARRDTCCLVVSMLVPMQLTIVVSWQLMMVVCWQLLMVVCWQLAFIGLQRDLSWGYWWSPSTPSTCNVHQVCQVDCLVFVERSSRVASWGLGMATSYWPASLPIVASLVVMQCGVLSVLVSCFKLYEAMLVVHVLPNE